MNKIKYIFTLVVISLGILSCDLNREPADKVPTKKAIRSIADCQVAMNGIYSHFKSSSYYARNFTIVPDLLTDEVHSVSGYSNAYMDIHTWKFTSKNSEITGFWSIMYSTIANSNFLLEKMEDVKYTASQKATYDNIKGSAYLARAIAYFDLVRLFGKTYDVTTAGQELGVPVVTKFEITKPARNTVQEVYDQILKDANEAKKLITGTKVDKGTDLDSKYFTKTLVDAFLARVYLTMQDWENAKKHATEVIGNSAYTLVDGSDFTNIWTNDKGKEIIWKVALTTNDAANGTLGYRYINDAQGLPGPDYIPSEQMVNLYDTKDIRATAYFKEMATRYNWTGKLISKYPTNPKFASVVNGNGANMAKVYRLPEMYLIQAEANFNLGNEAEALKAYNTLRSHRITGYADEALSGTVLKQAIKAERLRELAYEGHRWFDLKRWKQGFKRTPQDHTNNIVGHNTLEVTPDNYRWLLPIPEAEINANKNIVNNPGY